MKSNEITLSDLIKITDDIYITELMNQLKSKYGVKDDYFKWIRNKL